MCVKPANLSTWKTWLQLIGCGKNTPACSSFLDFVHVYFPSCPSRLARHIASSGTDLHSWHAMEAYWEERMLTFVQSPWTGWRHQHWVPGALASSCLCPEEVARGSWIPSLSRISQTAQWKDPPPRFSYQGCQVDECLRRAQYSPAPWKLTQEILGPKLKTSP